MFQYQLSIRKSRWSKNSQLTLITTGEKSVTEETKKTICMYFSTLSDDLAMRREARELPIIEDNINIAKMKPWGISSSFGLRAGVHKKTKVYIEPSNKDCIAPSNAIFSSALHKQHNLSAWISRYHGIWIYWFHKINEIIFIHQK